MLLRRLPERFVPVSGGLWDRLWRWIGDNGIGSRELVFTYSRGNPVCSSTEWRFFVLGVPVV